MIFKYSQYIKFLRHIKEQYRVIPLRDWNGGNAIILRHDIDLDIEPAGRLAKIEKEHGIRSTYFVMISGNTYNAHASANRRILNEIGGEGFEIGLHFDPTIYGKISKDELQEKVDAEAGALANIVQREIRSVSLHCPSLEGTYPIFDNFLNSYDPRIFGPDRYFSDSMMRIVGDLYQFCEKSLSFPIQLLLHPMHFTENGGGYANIFQHYYLHQFRIVDETFKVNPTYRSAIFKGTRGPGSQSTPQNNDQIPGVDIQHS